MACLAGAIWMFLNGAYLVVLSFGPAELNDGGIPSPAADAVVSVMSWVFIVALPLGGYVANRYNVPDGVMIGGLVVTEQVFNLNGIGRLLVQSIQNQDYTMTQALVMLVVAVFVLTNTVVDLLYAWLDPRIRYG